MATQETRIKSNHHGMAERSVDRAKGSNAPIVVLLALLVSGASACTDECEPAFDFLLSAYDAQSRVQIPFYVLEFPDQSACLDGGNMNLSCGFFPNADVPDTAAFTAWAEGYDPATMSVTECGPETVVVNFYLNRRSS